jgi:pentalenene oxygenase
LYDRVFRNKTPESDTMTEPTAATPPPHAHAPRFTVIVPTYNRAALLPRALDSILSQTGDDVEILVIDDGSTDDTPAALARYGERIHALRQDHAGTFAACRRAYHAARGPWLIFVDSDDRLRPGAIAALRAAADAYPAARLVLARVCYVGQDGRETLSRHLPLSADPLANFAAFARGRFKAVIAGGLVQKAALTPFDGDHDYPHSMDTAVLGAALLHPCAQIDAVTLDVIAHPHRLRDDVGSIHRSGLRLADLLFTPAAVPPEAMRHRRAFVSTLERERARAYHRAGWHGEAWRAYARAVAASPSALADTRNLRRAAGSLARDLLRAPEGPSAAPPAHWLTGHRRPIWDDTVGFLRQCAAMRSPAVRLRLRPRTYLLLEPADGRHVLVANSRAYHKTGILRVDPVLAGGLIGANPPHHTQARRDFPFNFHRLAFDAFIPWAADTAARHLDAWAGPLAAEPGGGPGIVDVGFALRRLCADITGQVVLGCRDLDRTEHLTLLLRDAHQCSRRELRANLRWPSIPAPAWVPLRRRRKYAALRRGLTAWLDAHMRQTGADGPDVLAAMRRAQPAAAAAALRDPVLMIFLAVLEPVSVTLTWALELLADHPAVQDRVAAEAAAVFAGRAPTAEHVAGLRYTAAVVSETTRLYPNEWLLTRRATAEDRLPSGLRVRRGEEVMVSPYLFGHDGRFFPDPESFNPDRFASPPTWPTGAYIPFGAGPRACLGEQFARRELTLLLAMIVARYRFDPHPPGRGVLESPNLFSTQAAESRLSLRVSPRTAAAEGPPESAAGAPGVEVRP